MPTKQIQYGALYNWWVAQGKRLPAYGYLYNWYATQDTSEYTFAADGWHVPTKTEFDTLVTALGGRTVAGGHLKEDGTTYWNLDQADNSSGFSARGTGYRLDTDGTFINFKNNIWIWTTTQNEGYGYPAKYILAMIYNTDDTTINTLAVKGGCSIRLIKDSTDLQPGETGTYVGNDGKTYTTICIGDSSGVQEWLSENLAETKFSDGTDIPEVTGNAAWAALTTPARCSYANDETNAFTYSGIAPAGWHIPTEQDFYDLMLELDPDGTVTSNTAGGNMKDIGTTYWESPNTDADNSSGFTARGAGIRSSAGTFSNIKYIAEFWNEYGVSTVGQVSYIYSYEGIFHTAEPGVSAITINKKTGLVIRLVKDDATDPGTVTDYDGNVYTTVKIGDQVWTVQNLIVTHFNNGDLIPLDPDGVTGYYTDAEWAALTTGAMCYYDDDINNAWIMVSNRRIFIT